MTNELNPNFMFQGTATDLLLKAAKGQIDLNALAKQELASRGLGVRGEWIGFEAADKYWDHASMQRAVKTVSRWIDDIEAESAAAEPHVEVKSETGTWSVRTLTAENK
jgi:hypothetical protein